jgi:hypothetical protein
LEKIDFRFSLFWNCVTFSLAGLDIVKDLLLVGGWLGEFLKVVVLLVGTVTFERHLVNWEDGLFEAQAFPLRFVCELCLGSKVKVTLAIVFPTNGAPNSKEPLCAFWRLSGFLPSIAIR